MCNIRTSFRFHRVEQGFVSKNEGLGKPGEGQAVIGYGILQRAANKVPSDREVITFPPVQAAYQAFPGFPRDLRAFSALLKKTIKKQH
jgi:hypothetical protein